MELTRILVPCDFSVTSGAALAHALNLPHGGNAELHLLHVVSESGPTLRRNAEGTGNHQQIYEQLQALIPPEHRPKLTPTFAVRHGKPVREILAYAAEHGIQLVVMGTHGRSGFVHMAMGSVSEKIVRSARCPVLVIPRDRRDDATLIRQSAESLAREFGETLYGERRSTEAQLTERLERVVGVDPLRAKQLFGTLVEKGVLVWSGSPESAAGSAPTAAKGEWRIGPPPPVPAAPASVAAAPANFESAPATDLLARALAARASDIHLDPWSTDEYLIRFRIDGVLEKYCRLDTDIAARLIQQFKMLANLDIADPFHPHEGRLRVPSSLGSNEIRITTSPTVGGEAIALRIFSLDSVFRELSQLGFTEPAMQSARQILRRGEGIVLVTGPTGSGKTTTVYSMLAELGDGRRNIVSIEDPVEYPIPFVRQMSVDEKHGITMTTGLRTILRMDPDVVFVGEIRDVEAAEIGMRAASSGKYVFSTLHTRDVASTVTAVRDLRIDKRSLAGNLAGILNQRLVRRLCPACRAAVPLSATDQAIFRENGLEPPEVVHEPRGCEACRGRGFLGRAGVFEVAVVDAPVASAIAQEMPEMELRQLLRSRGARSLIADALLKVMDGTTSLNEALEISWI